MASPIPTTLPDQIETLGVFVESVDELLASSFLKQVSTTGLSTTMSWVQGGVLETTRSGPEHEAVKAFLLTVRMFCQNNDATSIGNMKAMVPTLPVSQDLKDNFAKSAANFNKFLDSPPSIGFSVEGSGTRRQIFETFLYGKFAHSTLAKRRRHHAWASTPEYDDLRMYFDRILFEFVKVLGALATNCRSMLQELPPQ